MKTNEEFYDELSGYYNEMINFDEAIFQREKGLKNFITEKIRAVADIGCGTGIDSLALSGLGAEVTAFDLSSQMLEKAKIAASTRKVHIEFVKASADNIPGIYKNKFSLVVSLGNTLANLDQLQVKNALRNCYSILKEEGVLLLQVLNFARILIENERIINITNKGEHWYVRFYDFMEEGINFNILKFNSSNPAERTLNTTRLFPHTYQLLTDFLKDAGFTEIKLWENFNRKLFEPASSKDLIIEAFK